jgi:hypothetical protein
MHVTYRSIKAVNAAMDPGSLRIARVCPVRCDAGHLAAMMCWGVGRGLFIRAMTSVIKGKQTEPCNAAADIVMQHAVPILLANWLKK